MPDHAPPPSYDVTMDAYPVPTTLSPSRVEAFTSCPLAFRFTSLDKLPERPSVHTTKGSLVHRALELLFIRPAHERTHAAAMDALDRAISDYLTDPEFTLLGLDDTATAEFWNDARSLVDAYLTLEDPRAVRDIGLELRLEADAGGVSLRGIIDRLELDADGELVVTDYKTGRSPGAGYEQRRLAGVHVYAFLCESVLGRRPRRIRLVYIRDRVVIEFTPSEQSTRFVTTRTGAVWRAVERACATGDFRPRPSALCGSCDFQQWCPAFGGDPDRALIEAPSLLSVAAA